MHTPPVQVPEPRLALESTLLLHGVPAHCAVALSDELESIARENGANPMLLGVNTGALGRLSRAGLEKLLTERTPKLSSGNLGALVSQGWSGATTVSTTMELAVGMGIRVFSTGGLGGVHRGFSDRMDVSADLHAFTRFPVAVVTAGCKSILDVINTREVLETLGVPVIGYRCDRFPAFYRRDGGTGVDARFDEIEPLARFVRRELARSRRGVVICNPIPQEHELSESDWHGWLAQAEAKARAAGVTGRDVTPAVLGAVHEVSGGKTLQANIELVKHNVAVGARLTAAIGV